ncbi:MAG: hypothetical protein WDN46_01815 [Methylocella sp.]
MIDHGGHECVTFLYPLPLHLDEIATAVAPGTHFWSSIGLPPEK